MGEVFAGRYELADPIGRGGVGAVWRAWDHRRRRYVAAKVLQQRDAHSLLRFVREQALRIDHPHVLAPASWAADDDKVLFTMDLVAGGSLVHLVGDYGPLPPSFVCTLLDQLLSGLAAVHEEGVVHRDIKPANILLEATGTGRPRLRLSDFGIAMRLGEPRLTETNLVVGTPGYLAPEQMLGAEPDFRADLFAVGLVALYLLEGAKPDAKALVQHFAEHGTPGAPKGVPEPLWQVVSTLLQPDPEARFRTATGARKALASATELLPEPGLDDEVIEVFDQLGPLPPGFGPDGPFRTASGVDTQVDSAARPGPPGPAGTGTVSGAWSTGVAAAGGAAAGVARPGAVGPEDASGAQDVSSPANGLPEQVPPQTSARPGPSDMHSVPGAPATPAGPPYLRSDSDPGDSGHTGSGPGGSDPIGSGPGNSGAIGSGPGNSGAIGSGPGDSGAGDSNPVDSGRTAPGPTASVPRSSDNSPAGNFPSGNSPSDPALCDNSPFAPARSAPPASAASRGPEAAVPADPQEGGGPQPFTMSDTGSFHLPPPQPARPPGTGTDTSGTPLSQGHPPPTHQAGPPRHHPQHDLHQPQHDRRHPQHGQPQPLHDPPPHHPDQPPTATAHTHAHVSPNDPAHGPTEAQSSFRPQAPWNPAPAPLPPMRPQRADASTASYTAQNPQAPHPAQANSPSAPPPPRRAARRTHRAHRTRRTPHPGPPAKAAIPILLLALACYAVGFWALTRI
ncbi:protein kinase [Streptomyces sp. NPDC001508]|uniref:serine/threonine-protein kinase n=1 Tax=Streptomyces sp. NPDC001508 TaxID=3154656 RepID=UPI0033173E43